MGCLRCRVCLPSPKPSLARLGSSEQFIWSEAGRQHVRTKSTVSTCAQVRQISPSSRRGSRIGIVCSDARTWELVALPTTRPLRTFRPRSFRRYNLIRSVIVALCLATSAQAQPAGPNLQLVTPKEAARPNGPERESRGGLFPGPSIRVMIPNADSIVRPVHSPLRLKVVFDPRNAGDVETSTVRLFLDKSPPVDLTSRVLPFVTKQGFDLTRVSLPLGTHKFIVSVLDSNGNRGLATYTLTVVK